MVNHLIMVVCGIVIFFAIAGAGGCSDHADTGKSEKYARESSQEKPGGQIDSQGLPVPESLIEGIGAPGLPELARLAPWPMVELSEKPNGTRLALILEELRGQTDSLPFHVTLHARQEVANRQISLDFAKAPFWEMLGKLAVAGGVGLEFYNPSGDAELYISFTDDWTLLPGFLASGPALIGIMQRAVAPGFVADRLRNPASGKAPEYLLVVGAHWQQLTIVGPPVLRWTSSGGEQNQGQPCGRSPWKDLTPLPDVPEAQTGSLCRLEGYIPVRVTWDVKDTTVPLKKGTWPIHGRKVTGLVTSSATRSGDPQWFAVDLSWDPQYESHDLLDAYTAVFLADSSFTTRWDALVKLNSKGRHYGVVDIVGLGPGGQRRPGGRTTLQGEPGLQSFHASWDVGARLNEVKLWTGQWGYFHLGISLPLPKRTFLPPPETSPKATEQPRGGAGEKSYKSFTHPYSVVNAFAYHCRTFVDYEALPKCCLTREGR